MRIAFFSPLNPQATGISDYSEELLPELARLVDVDVFVDGYTPSNPDVASYCTIFDCAEYAERQAARPYDLNLYQMGNSLHHASTYEILIRYPGVVVLHDVVLHHFFLELTHRRRNPSIYLREMAFARGPEGVAMGLRVLRGEHPPPLYDTPLIGRVIEVSLGVIVHSRFALRQVAAHGGRQVTTVPAHSVPLQPASELDRRRVRAELGIYPGEVVFGAFGHANPPKRLDVALRAFSKVHDLLPDVRLLIVGAVDPPGWLDRLIEELAIRDSVKITGSVDFEAFRRYIAASDVGINLRYPTAGETSASLLRILGAGRPVIVSDVGSFSELDDAFCFKIPVDSAEEHQLYCAMRMLANDEELRVSMGAKAQSYVLNAHVPSVTAQAYVDSLRQVISSARDIPQNGGRPLHPETIQSPRQSKYDQGTEPAVHLRRAVEDAFTDLGLTRSSFVRHGRNAYVIQ